MMIEGRLIAQTNNTNNNSANNTVRDNSEKER